MRHIGLWIPHSSLYCRGQIATPTTLTRMSYAIYEQPSGLSPACQSWIIAQNTALGSYQNAQLSTTFQVHVDCTLYLSLSVSGTPPFYPTVVVNGVTKLSGTTSSTSMAVSIGVGQTLGFAISPVGPGTLAAGNIVFEAYLL